MGVYFYDAMTVEAKTISVDFKTQTEIRTRMVKMVEAVERAYSISGEILVITHHNDTCFGSLVTINKRIQPPPYSSTYILDIDPGRLGIFSKPVAEYVKDFVEKCPGVPLAMDQQSAQELCNGTFREDCSTYTIPVAGREITVYTSVSEDSSEI